MVDVLLHGRLRAKAKVFRWILFIGVAFLGCLMRGTEEVARRSLLALEVLPCTEMTVYIEKTTNYRYFRAWC